MACCLFGLCSRAAHTIIKTCQSTYVIFFACLYLSPSCIQYLLHALLHDKKSMHLILLCTTEKVMEQNTASKRG